MEPFEASLPYEFGDWVRGYRAIARRQPKSRLWAVLGPPLVAVVGFVMAGGGSDGVTTGISMALIVTLLRFGTPYLQAGQTMRIQAPSPTPTSSRSASTPTG